MYSMSLEEKIFDKIFSSGEEGVKKIALKKEYPGTDFDKKIEEWLKTGEVVIAKKANTYYYWHKDNYFQYLINSDAKFKYIYELLKDLQDSFHGLSSSVNKHVEKLDGRLILLMDSLLTNSNQRYEESVLKPEKTIDLNTFKLDFDLSISKNAGSIGWVALSIVRNDLCLKHELTEKQFYYYTKELIDQYKNNYELSSGGEEGIIIRGLLHGFVRCL